MKKQTLKLAAFKSQLAKSQVIDQANAKNLKGGGDPPPWGSNRVMGDPPPWGHN